MKVEGVLAPHTSPLPTPGAIGSIETPENEIRILAERSHSYVCPKCKATEKILPPRQCVVCSKEVI